MKKLLRILFTICVLLLTASGAWAGARFCPGLIYEPFTRSKPETSGVVRLGGAFRMIVDMPLDRLGAELEALYVTETTPFPNDNSLKEIAYRGRAGLNYRVKDWEPLHLNVRGGFQYNILHDTYFVKGVDQTIVTVFKHPTAYGGFEFELLPMAGFGLQMGATISGDQAQNKWIPQFYLAIVLR